MVSVIIWLSLITGHLSIYHHLLYFSDKLTDIEEMSKSSEIEKILERICLEQLVRPSIQGAIVEEGYR